SNVASMASEHSAAPANANSAGPNETCIEMLRRSSAISAPSRKTSTIAQVRSAGTTVKAFLTEPGARPKQTQHAMASTALSLKGGMSSSVSTTTAESSGAPASVRKCNPENTSTVLKRPLGKATEATGNQSASPNRARPMPAQLDA